MRIRCCSLQALATLALLFGVGLAQRPSNASLCDYYAESLYGANNSDTQLQLVKGIVALAFGGRFNLSNVSSDITGILNPGVYQGLNVDLTPWFDGSIPSTNLNNQPVGINWLDGGGLDPIYNYLTGATPDVVLKITTNEYRLFSHFFVAHSNLFGCSNPPPSDTGPPLNLAYVHKYMNLNYTDVAYFIDQLSKATGHFGFSNLDSQTLSNQLNSLHNVRCAPPITQNPTQSPQVLSLCQADNCPLAEPNPDCAAYVNLTAEGFVSSVVSTQLSTTTSAPSTYSTASTATSASISVLTTSYPPTSSTSTTTPTLSAGAIAGIAIGGAATLILVIGALVYFRKQRRSPEESQSHSSSFGFRSPSTTRNHSSNVSTGHPLAEMSSPRPTSSPEMSLQNPVEIGGYERREQLLGRRG